MFGLLTMLLAYIAGSIAKRGQEYEEAFTRVAKVMQKSPTPYVRLDQNDYICDYSIGFCKMLGYDDCDQHTETKLRSTTLGSLCADDKSREKYADVQKNRRERKSVDFPYLLNLITQGDKHIAVSVYSADIPSNTATAYSDSLPETFGIFVSGESASDKDTTANKKSFNDSPTGVVNI